MQEMLENHQHEIDMRSFDIDSEKIRMGMMGGYASDIGPDNDD